MKSLILTLKQIKKLHESNIKMKVRAKDGHLATINNVVKKENKKAITINFENGLTRTVAETHRFSYNNNEIYAKDAIEVDMIQGKKLKIINKDFLKKPINVYDIMIDEIWWYCCEINILMRC